MTIERLSYDISSVSLKMLNPRRNIKLYKIKIKKERKLLFGGGSVWWGGRALVYLYVPSDVAIYMSFKFCQGDLTLIIS